MKHVILIPFSGVGLFDDPDDNDWLTYRISIFLEYTWKSLLNQTRRPDLIWLSFDGRNNSFVQALVRHMSKEIPTVSTHYGLPYKDDKFTLSGIKYAPRMLGRAIRRKKPRLFFRYVWRLIYKNISLRWRVKPPYEGWAMITRMDSDDCLHKNYLAEADNIVMDKGFVYNSHTGEVCEWNPTTCPQFVSVGVWSEDWNKVWKSYTSHEDSPKAFKVGKLDKRYYLMVMHSNQISSTWDHPFRGKGVSVDVLRDFIHTDY